jgi:hypothetical protein
MIANQEGNRKLAKEYYKKCLNHCSHVEIISFCEKELKQ